VSPHASETRRPASTKQASEREVATSTLGLGLALRSGLPELGEHERRVLGSERPCLGLRALRREPIARDAGERVQHHVVPLAGEADYGAERGQDVVCRPLREPGLVTAIDHAENVALPELGELASADRGRHEVAQLRVRYV
jgi:hypothetical protein